MSLPKRMWSVLIWSLVLAAPSVAMAATCTSKASGNWNAVATWNCTAGSTPGSGDTVVLASPYTVSLNNNDRTVASLTINSGATMNDDNKDLTVNGNVVNNGTFGTNGGALIMRGTNATLSGTGTFDNADVQIDAPGISLPSGSAMTLTDGAQVRVGRDNPGTFALNGTIQTGSPWSSGDRILWVYENSSAAVNGTINASSAYVQVQQNSTLTNNGSVNVQYLDSDGNNSTSVWTQGANSSLTVSQTPSNDWRGTLNASASGNTVTYNGTATPLTPSSSTYYNLAGTAVTCPHGFIILGSDPCPVVAPSVRAEYRFDECSWTSGTANAVADSTGNGYDGTPYSVNTAAGGVVQRAADFSAAGTSDYVHWPIGLMNGMTDFTVSTWFKTSVNQAQQEILHGLGSRTNDDEIEIYLVNTTGIRVNIRDNGNNYTAGSSFVDGAWHHLAVTRSGSSVCVYLDATSLGCNTQAGALSITNASALVSGQEQDSYGGSFQDNQSLRAQLDEFKVFNSALSSTQITNIRSNELAGNNWDGTARALACTPPVMSIANASTTEGNSGTKTLSFTVSLSSTWGSTASASYATSDGTATGGASCTTGVDYVTTSGTVSVVAGQTTATLDVTLCGDTTYEAGETFTVTLSNPVNATLGTSTATGTITNDDNQPSVSIAAAVANEGNSGTSGLSLAVSLSNASYQNVSVNFTTANGTATGAAACATGIDYVTSSGTVNISAGSTSVAIPITVCGDTTFESHETVSVTLSSPVNATLGTATATGTILNDEAFAWYKMDETTWTATSGDVKDASGNGYHATRGGLATTVATAPLAYGDSTNGTCRYGRFDQTGTPNSYVELPTSFPAVNFSFTVTAWIRSTNINKIGQRIFVRDDNANGWGFSLSDSVAGTVRLFNRGTTPLFILDTPAVIANNTWYFVAVAVDMTSKTVTLYVYDRSTGTQLAKTSGTYTGTWGAGSGATSIGDETSVSAENGLYFSGNLDEVTVFNTALDQTAIESVRTRTRSCSCVLGSFKLTQTATALACPDTRAQVTVQPMCDDGTTVKNDYAGTVNLSTLPASGTYYDAASGGNTISSVAFLSGDLSKTAYLYFPNEASACAVANDGAISSTSASCTSFHAYGFKVSAQPADQVCSATSQITLTAYGKTLSGSGQACEVISGFSGNKNLKAWFTSGIDPDNPTTVQTGNRTLTITGSTSGITDKTEPATANLIDVSFSNGEATLTVSYPNAAKIFGINFKHNTAPYNGGTCGATEPFCPLTAAANAFLAYPNFALSVTDSGSDCAAGDSTCAVFKAAGDSFNMKLQALCSDGTTLATDYVNGTAAIPLAVNSLVAPSGGAEGAVGTATTNITSGGEKAFTQTWTEVGVATFKATPPTWFGHTFGASATGNIGRFRPHHFDTIVTHGCSSAFTYAGLAGTPSLAGQPFTVEVKAKRSGGDLNDNTNTANYAGATWAKAVTLSDAAAGTGTLANNTFAATAFASGKASRADVTYAMAAKLTAPYTLAMRATDTDSVSSSGHTEGSTVMRSGRLRLSNAFGSEKADLVLPVQAHYWSGKSWVLNSDDTCTGTGLAATAVALSGYTSAGTPSLAAGNLGTSHISGFAADGGGGRWKLTLTKPDLVDGKAPTGSVNVCVDLGEDPGSGAVCSATSAAKPWLQGKWPPGTNYDNDPSARATFGLYSQPEHRRTLHIREQF